MEPAIEKYFPRTMQTIHSIREALEQRREITHLYSKSDLKEIGISEAEIDFARLIAEQEGRNGR